MATGTQIGCKRKTRAKVRLKNKGSDESDEDYKVSEDEAEESEVKFISLLVGDESEDSLEEFCEEEEECTEKKVKKVGKPKARKGEQVRKKNSNVKPRKKRVTHKEEVDDDSDDYEDEFFSFKEVKKNKASRNKEEDDEEDDEFFSFKEVKKNKASGNNEEDGDTDFLYKEDDESVDKEPRKISLISRKKASRNTDFEIPRKKSIFSYTDAKEESDYDYGYDMESIPNNIFLDRVTRRTCVTRRVATRQNRSDTSKEVSDEKPTTVRKKKRTVRGRGRRKKFSVDSNSDIASSGSSDCEYTILEEEREQVRGASKRCSGLSSGLRSSGPSTINNEVQRKQPIKKGKEKVSHTKVVAAKQVCGICLSEEGKRTIRGFLNCCNHYFCFACIMEWSKVESRCPLCKQRFTVINRKVRADGGHDLRDAVFQVPERDQVYQPTEEELMGFLDPYDGVICSECHLGGDDALMLLCDLCDSPAHTYCVGLGHEVPDGNWYCEGCGPTANTSSNPQASNPTPDHGTANTFSVGSSPSRPTVRETFDLNEAYVPETPLTAQVPGHSHSPRTSYADRQSSLFASGYAAPTLESRRIQRQMHHFISTRDRLYESNESTAPASGINLFGSRISSDGTVTARPASIISHRVNLQGSSEYTSSFFWASDVSSYRPSGVREQVLPSEASASASLSYAGLQTQNEVLETNETSGAGFIPHQLRSFISRSNNGSDATAMPCEIREGTISSRTLQGPAYTHHF